MQNMVRRTRAAAPGKRMVISETGWPDQGSAFHGSVPSDEGAMRYFVDTMRWAREDDIEVFYFAAFDEAWKVGAEGDVGAYWGLWDKDGKPKFAMTHAARSFPRATPSATRATARGRTRTTKLYPSVAEIREDLHLLPGTGSCCACTTAACTPSACCR